MRTWRRAAASALIILVLLAACPRTPAGMPLLAAFSDDSVVGRITAVWNDSGERTATGSAEPRELAYRVEVVNQLGDPLFVRLRDFRILRGAAVVGRAGERAECVLQPGQSAVVLSGVLRASGTRDGFDVDRFAVPLSERGRAFYREFSLRQRPGDGAAIDAEIAAFLRAPGCADR